MWIPLLIGLGAGLLVVIGLMLQRDRRYRRLLSDGHFDELARALDRARTGTGETSEGLTLAWQAVGVYAALVVQVRGGLAPEAARFLLGVMAKASNKDITACLKLSSPRGALALIVPGPIPDAIGEARAPDIWRTAGVEAMRSQPLVEGALAAYR